MEVVAMLDEKISWEASFWITACHNRALPCFLPQYLLVDPLPLSSVRQLWPRPKGRVAAEELAQAEVTQSLETGAMAPEVGAVAEAVAVAMEAVG